MIYVYGAIFIDHLRVADGSKNASAAFPGGKALNIAVAAAKQYPGICLIGAVGQDQKGAEVLEYLQNQNVNTAQVQRSEKQTGEITYHLKEGIPVTKRTENDANTDTVFFPEDVEHFTDEDILIFHGIPNIEPDQDRVIDRLTEIRKHGAYVIFNPAPFFEFKPELYKVVDLIYVNDDEARQVADQFGIPYTNDRDLISGLCSHFGKDIIVTYGDRGAMGMVKGQWLERTPLISVTAVDTIGAGDTFIGYFASGMQRGHSLQQAFDKAMIAAALTCTKNGAANSIPNADRVESTYRQLNSNSQFRPN